MKLAKGASAKKKPPLALLVMIREASMIQCLVEMSVMQKLTHTQHVKARLTSSAVILSPDSKHTSFATRSRNPACASGNISCQLRRGKTVHSSKGETLKALASGHVSSVGVPSVLIMLSIKPSWFPSSWAGLDAKGGLGGLVMDSASITPVAHMSTGAP